MIVLQNYGRWPFTQWHYAVAIGYNSRSGNLILRSGETRELGEHLAIFEYTWKDGGYWAMVALPPSRTPATAERARYLEAFSNGMAMLMTPCSMEPRSPASRPIA